jgi:hypothetical protein
MLRRLTRAVGCVFIAIALVYAVAACENEALPTGNLVAQGGVPGGSTLGGGGGQSAFPAFDINNLPAPKFWNDLGGYEKLPDLFTFANGSKVTTADDWFGTEANNYHGRRWEIEQIVQHYEYGYMPDYGDNLTVTWSQTSDTALQINLSYEGAAGVKTANFSVTATIPSGTPPEGGFPTIINCGSGGAVGWGSARDGRYAGIGFNVDNAAQENASHGGVVDTLFGYDYINDPNAPSIFMAYAWAVGRIMDALETEQEGALPFNGAVNVNKLVITGMSRWGKGAEISAAFAKSKKGTQIQVCDIGSAGSGGPAIERFISPLGLHEEYSVTTTVTSTNIPGRIQYMEFIGENQGNTLVPATANYFTETGTDTSRPPYGTVYGPLGADLPNSPLVVRAITPARYKELLADAATKNTVFIYDPWPYEGVFNGNYWHGQETLAQLIRGSPTWFNGRFKQFRDTHYGLRVDDVGGLPTRTPDGFLSTIPYDQHFLLALIAPRAVIIHDGFRTVRNNPEGCFINHLAVDEVYKFLEEQGVKPAFAGETGFDATAKLSDFNAIKYYFIPHEQPEYELKDTFDMADVYFGYKAKTAISNYQERLLDPPYPIDDPRSKHDYQKLDWARPGAVPLSERVAGVPDFPYEKYKLEKWADQTD